MTMLSLMMGFDGAWKVGDEAKGENEECTKRQTNKGAAMTRQ